MSGYFCTRKGILRAFWWFCLPAFLSFCAANLHAAMEIQGIVSGTAPASNYDRFANSSAWIGNPANWAGGAPPGTSAYTWTGVGRDTSIGRWATMISPSFIVSASHFAPNVGDTVQFFLTNNPNGPSETRTVVAAESLQGSVTGDEGDVWVGKLSAPITDVASYPILQLPTSDNTAFGGLGIDTFGVSDSGTNATNVRLGRNVITPGSAKWGFAYNFTYDTPGLGPDESQVIEGDSGAPSFFLYGGGTPALTGLHWYNNDPVDTMSGDSFLPTYVNDIQTGMNQLGNTRGETVKTVSPVLGDFNLDGVRNTADITAMTAALGNLSGWESAHGMSDAYLNFIGDLNGDGKVNAADLQALQQLIKPSLSGDANGDGKVDGQDYLIFAKEWSQSGSSLPADFNHDGIVNFQDYMILAQNFGKVATGSLTAVPEPTSLLLLSLGGFALAAWAHRRSASRS
jgi:hypothetical protein